MLEDLQIQNFALIESVNLEFSQGFTVFTGETGAGKSILIGALSFLLGGKSGIDQIRAGAKEASVSGTFLLPDIPEINSWLSEHAIEADEHRVLLRRIIRDSGKSSAWIQNVPVTRSDLADFTSLLVDIHGQHEHQLLMKVSEHRRFLDAYAGLTQDTADFTRMYTQLIELRRKLDSLNIDDAARERRRDMLTFAVSEITEAKLHPDEDKELSAEENRLSRFEQLYTDLESITKMLSGDEYSLINSFRQFDSMLKRACSGDTELSALSGRTESVFYELTDISNSLRSYKDALVFDPVRLEEVQERTALFFRLKKKYASSVQAPLTEVIEYAKEAAAELDKLSGSEEEKQELATIISEMEQKILAAARRLSSVRKQAAEKMAKEVEYVLASLGMKNTHFQVLVSEKTVGEDGQKCGPYGIDNIEFLISANPGSPLRPLAKIASGGELSRVMLALKTVLAEGDPVETMIFDEIDTGIGGEVAVSLASHMKNLASARQIICITHLASIAVCADSQIKIQKKIVNGKTVTDVHIIDGSERVEEIARMLSGDSYSAESLDYARSLLNKNTGKG